MPVRGLTAIQLVQAFRRHGPVPDLIDLVEAGNEWSARASELTSLGRHSCCVPPPGFRRAAQSRHPAGSGPVQHVPATIPCNPSPTKLADVAKRLDEPFVRHGQRAQEPTASAGKYRYQSWNAVAEVGLPVDATDRARHRAWSDEDILQAVREAAAARDGGQTPFGEGRRRPWLATIIIRCGSWWVAESLAIGTAGRAGTAAEQIIETAGAAVWRRCLRG